ncbi:hypothetical protein IF1G_03414 [Cordyceps javanica]|uniref:Uncharacterized protein n=1 Tax=Cordyceps javanica TaxID=43265 RepID=A0A545V7I7_9HYPO|nr:hypothetical protein IF1G_03414 [Cordyceps javanica]
MYLRIHLYRVKFTGLGICSRSARVSSTSLQQKEVRLRRISGKSALSQAISSMQIGYVDRRDNCSIILSRGEKEQSEECTNLLQIYDRWRPGSLSKHN